MDFSPFEPAYILSNGEKKYLRIRDLNRGLTGNKIIKNVFVGDNVKIEDYCVFGEIDERDSKNSLTIIGDNSIIRSHTVIYSGNQIGNKFETGHGVLIRGKNKIGDNVSIGSHSDIEHNIKIGNNVIIHSGVFICEYSILEDDCWVGPYVIFTNTLHPKCNMAKKCMKGPIIEKGARVGAGAILLPGVTVGENSLVGGGSIVTKDVSKGAVVIGNPAKKVGEVNKLKCVSGLMKKPYEN